MLIQRTQVGFCRDPFNRHKAGVITYDTAWRGAQALISTAVGLPPSTFRRLLQNNGASTAIRFEAGAAAGAPALALIEHVNQVPSLARLEQSQAPAAGQVRVYLVPLSDASLKNGSEQRSAIDILQVQLYPRLDFVYHAYS